MEVLIFLVSFLTILNTIFHVTHIFSSTGFKNGYLFFISLIILFLYNISFLTIFSYFFLKKFSNTYFFLFSLYHYLAFFFIYFFIICLTIVLKYFSLITEYFILLFFKFDFNLIPNEYKIMHTPIYKNTVFLRKVFFVSYLLSILTFIFISKNYLLFLAKNDPSINKSLFKEDIQLYYSAFFIYAIPIIISLKKSKN